MKKKGYNASEIFSTVFIKDQSIIIVTYVITSSHHSVLFAVILSPKEIATHSSTLAWRIPWMEEPGRLQSMGSLRVGHDFTFTFHFHALEKKWQPTPVFLPGESQGQRSLAGCRLWGRTESDTTEAT